MPMLLDEPVTTILSSSPEDDTAIGSSGNTLRAYEHEVRKLILKEAIYWKAKVVIGRLQEKLIQLKELQEGWDSYGAHAPQPSTIEGAEKVLALLEPFDLLYAKLIPSAEGGVAVFFNEGTKTAYLEFQNSGDVVLAMYDREGEPQIIELTDTDDDKARGLELIRHYVFSQPDASGRASCPPNVCE